MESNRAFHITFVCTGNTCRSPMAEAIARGIIAEKGVSGVTVGSAGTAARPGAPASEGARGVAAEAGLGLESHRSAVLTEEVVASSAMILCMDGVHLWRARELGAADNCHLLTEMAGGSGEVEDPFGGPDEVYRATFRELARLVGAVLGGIDGGGAKAVTYALLGDPVAHSLSPAIHGAAFRAAGRRAVYEARRVSAEECGPALRALALGGGGGNVTVPHKERVLPFLDRRTRAVSVTGACNTFWAEGGEVRGDNTDVEGFLGAWEKAVAGLPDGLGALVLGAGGAARAVLFALLDASGVSRIEVWNRTPVRARVLARHFKDDRLRPVSEWRGKAPDVVVNATSAGLDGRGTPMDLRALAAPPRQLIDLVYGEQATPICRQAGELGIPATDGREMLVRQAEASYGRWFGEPPPRGVMRRALD